MVRLCCGKGQTGADVFLLQVRKIREYFDFAHPGGHKIEDILDPDAHAADARATAALVRIESDAVHDREANPRAAVGKESESVRRQYRGGAWLKNARTAATRLAISDMERAAIDIITDGEIRRESYSNRFATAL
jgi:hypothetical protein